MDSMDYIDGLDKEIEKTEDEEQNTEVLTVTQPAKPFHEWNVAGNVYKLKLRSQDIKKLEQSFHDSLLNAVLDKGIPPVGVVTTIIQASMQKYQHGMKIRTVEDLYDSYIDGGKTQIDLLREVIYPLMGDAGFFTKAQLDLMTKEMQEIDTDL